MIETIRSLFLEPCTWWFNCWGSRNWEHCCKAHDRGWGNCDLQYDKAAWKLMCDEELRDCVNKEMPGMGTIMFLGVTFPGWFVYWIKVLKLGANQWLRLGPEFI